MHYYLWGALCRTKTVETRSYVLMFLRLVGDIGPVYFDHLLH